MLVRSDFIFHWTGKDFEEMSHMGNNPCSTEDAKANMYIKRLIGTINDGGLWMTKPEEKIKGREDYSFDYRAAMTCFTETRLSQSHKHAVEYGHMGFGFSRRFALERYGGPVHYVRNREGEILVENVWVVNKVLLDLLKNESNLKAHEKERVQSLLAYNVAHMKGMSDANAICEDMARLDEFEWRIVQSERAVKDNKIDRKEGRNPEYKIPFTSDDLKILVVPNEEVAERAWRNSDFKGWLERAKHPPAILTLKQCEGL